jgi:hypothetical protein
MLAQRIERLPDDDGTAVDETYSIVVSFWAAGLLPHFTAEQDCLLARLLRHVDSSDPRAQRLRTDHAYIESLVTTMRATADSSVRRNALDEFAERLRNHVRWEEDTLFEATERLLSEDELNALDAELAARLPAFPARYDAAAR